MQVFLVLWLSIVALLIIIVPKRLNQKLNQKLNQNHVQKYTLNSTTFREYNLYPAPKTHQNRSKFINLLITDSMNNSTSNSTSILNSTSNSTSHSTSNSTTNPTANPVTNTPVSPKVTKISASLVIMVISSRSHISQRKTIRETWAKNRTNIIFIVGKEYCPIPEQFRKHAWECKFKQMRNPELVELNKNKLFQKKPDELALKSLAKLQKTLTDFDSFEKKRNIALQNEPNVVLVEGFIDSYRNLSAKIFTGYKWISENFEMGELKWVMKCDDDVYVRVDKLEEYLKIAQERKVRNEFSYFGGFSNYIPGRVFDYKKPVVIGHMNSGTMVLDRGDKEMKKNLKWADNDFVEPKMKNKGREGRTKYPIYPDGGASYIFSRFIFDYIIENIEEQIQNGNNDFYSDKNGVFNWPLEDAGFGIMMYRSPFRDQIGLFNRCNSTLDHGKDRRRCRDDAELENSGGVLVGERAKHGCSGSFRNIVFSHGLSPKWIRDCYKRLNGRD